MVLRSWPSSPIRVCEESFGYDGFSGRRVLQGRKWHERFSLTAYLDVLRIPAWDSNRSLEMALANFENATYKTVRPKLDVSQSNTVPFMN
jgi:hypothetical protein